VRGELAAKGNTDETGAVDFGADVQSRWWFDTLAELIAGLDRLAAIDPRVSADAAMRTRFEAARDLRRVTVDDHAAAWLAASEGIRQSSRYGGLVVAPRSGLVPLGADPLSGLFEFALFLTGEIPMRDPASGSLRLEEDSAAVLVLLPGGDFTMGAQATDPAAPNYEISVGAVEEPVGVVSLAPFFCGKHELTQHQYRRIMSTNPSTFPAGENYRNHTITAAHPVETLTWNDAVAFTERLGGGVALPTEAQWEYAARGGTSTRWWCGDDPAELDSVANLCDLTAKQNYGDESWQYDDTLEDGFTATAPVGSLRANPFGLHDVHGNVAEWGSGPPLPYTIAARKGDGLRQIEFEMRQRIVRGGSFTTLPFAARCAHRMVQVADQAMSAIGFRIVLNFAP
jgi:formylglycine-generating enzyme required for sulfatase activity